ncbi:MAG: hypothetical protein ACJ788_01965 [Ktedonobacteraceae bacterium]
MENTSQPSTGGFSEHNERSVQHTGLETLSDELHRERMLLNRLMRMGFLWQEAARLLDLRDHLYENTEMRQRQAEDNRLLFARWLYDQGEITEK